MTVRNQDFDQKSFLVNFVVVLIIGLAVRLFLAFVVPPAYDIWAWQEYANYWKTGHLSPYQNFETVPSFRYSPFWFFFVVLSSLFSQSTGLSFGFSIRLPIIIADLFLLWVIARSCKKLNLNKKTSLIIVAGFFLNPVSLLTSGLYGQFDNFSVLFALLAWYAGSFTVKNRSFLSFLFLTLSIAAKHFTVMLVPAFAYLQKSWLKKLLVLCAAPLLFFVSILPFAGLDGILTIVQRLFQYNLHAGYWGWSGVICRSILFFTHIDLIQEPWFKYLDHFNSLLYFGILIASYWITKQFDLLDSILIVFLIFYSFTTQIAPQYTIWIIPFAALRPNRYFYAYSLVGGVQVATFYYVHYHWWRHDPLLGVIANLIPETFILFRYLTWFVCALWLVHMLGLFGKHRKQLNA